MSDRAPWWRRLGGALAACLVVLLTAAPAVDDLACAADGLAQAQAVKSIIAKSDVASEHQHPQRPPSGAADVCPHGHVHSVAPAPPVAPSLTEATWSWTEPLPPANTAVRESSIPRRLERPPRV